MAKRKSRKPKFDLNATKGKIIIDATGVEDAIKQIKGLTILPGPVTAYDESRVHYASDFESALAEISVRTGVTGEDLNEISDLCLQVGVDTPLSAQQAAAFILERLAAGDELEDALERLEGLE